MSCARAAGLAVIAECQKAIRAAARIDCGCAISFPWQKKSGAMTGAPNSNRNPKRGSPTGALLMGVSLLALASYWPELTGAQPDAADHLYLGFMKFIGGLAVLGGLTGYYKTWVQAQKRAEAEKPSGTFGEAAFATLDECHQAGLDGPDSERLVPCLMTAALLLRQSTLADRRASAPGQGHQCCDPEPAP